MDVAKDVAGGVVDAAEEIGKTGWDLVSARPGSMPGDAGAAVRSLLVDTPVAVVKDVASDAKSAASDLATLAGGVLGLSTLGLL